MTLPMSYLITIGPGPIFNELLSWLVYLNRGTVLLQLLLVGVVMVAEQRGALRRSVRHRLVPEPQLLSASGWAYEVGSNPLPLLPEEVTQLEATDLDKARVFRKQGRQQEPQPQDRRPPDPREELQGHGYSSQRAYP